MLDIVLNILVGLGIVLLMLLAVLLVVILLVLFFPITYRAFGKKNPEEMSAWLKVNWLFGLLRVRFFYPEPGNLTVKLLWFTLFDTAQKNQQKTEDNKTGELAGQSSQEISQTQDKKQDTSKVADEQAVLPIADTTQANTTATDEVAGVDGAELNGVDVAATSSSAASEADNEEAVSQEKGLKHWILSKYEKIKYTIRKFYDKIKHIWENITFYKALLQDEQTVALVRHAWFRLGRILKNIRPRKIKGEVLFGTGSPDTTGYAFGVYGMLLPWLGKHINVTPDFTQSILEGELYIAGHITVFQVLRHSLMVILDKRLRLLLHRIKTHKI